MAEPSSSPRACLASGYKYLLRSKKSWQRAPDERWETVMRGETCGEHVGSRVIDGARVEVVRVGRQNDGAGRRFYAALPMHFSRRAGARRR